VSKLRENSRFPAPPSSALHWKVHRGGARNDSGWRVRKSSYNSAKLPFRHALNAAVLAELVNTMLAEWTVELGADDARLEIPWSTEDGSSRYLDLKRQPELLLEVPEACMYPELAEFLNWANSPESPFETAKCDAWTSGEMDVEDEVSGEASKFGSYVDLLFVDKASRKQFEENERFVQALVKLVRRAPELASSAEFTVRRCLDRRDRTEECFYITFYLNGYGQDEHQARSRWAIALKMVENAMRQHSVSRLRA
jgi:hypothetical protein